MRTMCQYAYYEAGWQLFLVLV